MRCGSISAGANFDRWPLFVLRAGTILLIVLMSCSRSSAYSVLTHEEIVDLLWTDQIQPLLLKRFPALQENSAAHRAEHAIEVQLPFLQAQQGKLHIVPIAVGTSNFEVLRGLGEAVAEVVGAFGEKVLIVASSDMNHYEPDAITRVKDHKAIERVLAMDARGLWEVVMNEDISMCGFGPTIVMLTAAKILGATAATLVKYATSGDVSGDRETVVGYAGIIVV